jgi:hypothetical protein
MTVGHVLLVSDHFRARSDAPDSRSYNLSGSLAAVNWNVTVLTSSAIPDDHQSTSVHDGASVRVVSVPAPAHPNDPKLTAWPTARHQDPQTWATKDQTARAASWFDDELALWRPRLEATAINIESSQHVDLVICLVPHLTTLSVGSLFHSLFRTPYAIDIAGEIGTHRDEWRWMVQNAHYRWCSASTLTASAGFHFECVENWNPKALAHALSGWTPQP